MIWKIRYFECWSYINIFMLSLTYFWILLKMPNNLGRVFLLNRILFLIWTFQHLRKIWGTRIKISRYNRRWVLSFLWQRNGYLFERTWENLSQLPKSSVSKYLPILFHSNWWMLHWATWYIQEYNGEKCQQVRIGRKCQNLRTR